LFNHLFQVLGLIKKYLKKTFVFEFYFMGKVVIIVLLEIFNICLVINIIRLVAHFVPLRISFVSLRIDFMLLRANFVSLCTYFSAKLAYIVVNNKRILLKFLITIDFGVGWVLKTVLSY